LSEARITVSKYLLKYMPPDEPKYSTKSKLRKMYKDFKKVEIVKIQVILC
jgi:hypothetical protein